MAAVDIVALTAATIAGVLALVAVFRAIEFYRLSARQAEQILQAEQNIAAGLRQFDRLFETLYHDAMTLAKTAVFQAAEAKAAPPPADAPANSSLKPADIDAKLAAMKHEILDALAGLLARAKAERGGQATGQLIGHPAGPVETQPVGPVGGPPDKPPMGGSLAGEAMSAEMAEIIDRAIAQSRCNSTQT